ncbi:MAG: ferrous iron transport protein B [Gaiellales bacterium]|nr:ferrous iron transport protein B [Gaiellales bacterium]
MAADEASTSPSQGKPIVVLVGNPNVGKSLFFNAFTGQYVDVSNYPGTTIEIARGTAGDVTVVDTPGIYGVSAFTAEERVAREVIRRADVVLNVVDASNLERDLFLTQQLCDMGLPMVVALNLMDEADRRGVKVDAKALVEELGVEVISTVAVKRAGFGEVREALRRARPGRPNPDLEPRLARWETRVARRGDALLVLEGDQEVAAEYGLEPGGARDELYRARRVRVNRLAARVIRQGTGAGAFRSRLGGVLMRPLTGFPILLLVLACIYFFLGVLVAQTLVGFTEGTVMGGYVEPFLRRLVASVAGDSGTIFQLFAGSYGVITLTITYLLGLLLPLVLGFYFLMALLEDCGYLPRLAALTDRLMGSIGLNGLAVIPMILGLGCVTMAAMSTRMLGSERERKIATALMALTIPCSAQLGIIAAVLAGQGGAWVTAAYLAIMIVLLGGIGRLLDRFSPGRASDLLLDLPPLRLPRPGNVFNKTFRKTWSFLKEAAVYFLAGSAVLSILDVSGGLAAIQRALAPLVTGWLRLPPESAEAFMLGMVRREFAAVRLYDLALSGSSVLVAMVTVTLFVPCLASVLVILKERGRTFTALVWVGSVGLAFLVGGVVAQVARLAGW